MKELNEKLAKWAGFQPRDHSENDDHRVVHEWRTWPLPSGGPIPEIRDYVPDFTNDLNACFKWLVPHIGMVWIETGSWGKDGEDEAGTDSTISIWSNKEDNWSYHSSDENPALALCRAIEKVIDASD